MAWSFENQKYVCSQHPGRKLLATIKRVREFNEGTIYRTVGMAMRAYKGGGDPRGLGQGRPVVRGDVERGTRQCRKPGQADRK